MVAAQGRRVITRLTSGISAGRPRTSEKLAPGQPSQCSSGLVERDAVSAGVVDDGGTWFPVVVLRLSYLGRPCGDSAGMHAVHVLDKEAEAGVAPWMVAGRALRLDAEPEERVGLPGPELEGGAEFLELAAEHVAVEFDCPRQVVGVNGDLNGRQIVCADMGRPSGWMNSLR